MDPSQMMNRSFPTWAPSPLPPPAASEDPSAAFAAGFMPPPPNRGWKRKNPSAPSAAGGYQPPALGDLQVQNRAKARRWFKNPNNPNHNHHRKYFFPNNKNNKATAPRNTTSYIIRAKRAGGIASLVSPCPVTPAVLPTPRLSPSREGLADEAQAQWGVDGYGTMKGLIRLRSSPHAQPANPNEASDDEDSSGSDVEEHVEVERRLDHDLSRFEMVYPARGEDAGGYVFEEDDEYDQDVHVARLEEENLTLKERLFLMEQEVGDMRRRLEALEARFAQPDAVGAADNEAPPVYDAERVDVGSENTSEERADMGSEKSQEKNDANKAVAVSGNIAENSADKGDEDSEKRHKGHLDSEKTGQHNAAEKVVVDSEKTGQHNAAEKSAVDSEKNVQHNAEKGAVDSEKTGEPNADIVVVDSEKELNAENRDVDSEIVDSVPDKSGEDNGEECRL